MTWKAPARSAQAAAIYEAAEADRKVRPERYVLDPEIAVENALQKGVEASDFAEGWRSGLERYLASADVDGRLNALGRRMVADTAVARLVAGARVAERFSREPSLHETPLAPPIMIVGGWRTGTTFLFRLLGSDPRLHAPVPAELGAPWRFPDFDEKEREQFIDKGARAHDTLHLLNPTMAAVHLSGARLAEECVLAMGTDFRNWGFTSTVRLNSYAEWLATQDFTGSYHRYRQALQLLAVRDPRRFVLKAPAHTAELDHLASTFPGAIVVHLHRDIVETIASGSSLFAVFRSTYSDEVDAHDVGHFQTQQTELWFRRAAAFRASSAARSVRIIDVDYTRLVQDPAGVLRSIYETADLAPPDDLDAFVEQYHRGNPRSAHGEHRYQPSDFGLDPAQLRDRFAFLDK